MRSSFSGLDIAYRALQAQQQALDVVNQNIANANTPGYSRQVAEMAATPPYTFPALNRDASAGQLGTGVAVVDIGRSRSSFIDYQIRGESQSQGQWEKMRDALQQVEVVLDESSDSGLNSLLSKFWQSWQDLANSPQDASARKALIEQADSLAVSFNRKYSQLAAIQQDLDKQISMGTDQLNQLAQQIADLNVGIAQVELDGQRANDLRDRRDNLLDQLSKMAHVTYYENADGTVNVFLGGHQMVSRDQSQPLSVVTNANGLSDVIWQRDGSSATFSDGEFYGMLQARDVVLPKYIGSIQSLAGQLISSVNTIHQSGYGLDNSTGLNFFNGTDASNIAINPALDSAPEKIAAGANINSYGDNTQALAIASLQRALTMGNGTSDFGKFLASTIAALGVDSQRADSMAENQKTLVDHLARQKEAMSGVSLDEESTHLIQYQRAYQAASRVMNAVDEMLDRLINNTGLVGR